MKHVIIIVLVGVLVTGNIAVPTDEDVRGREDLSDHTHYSSDGKHNVEYDHEAFLGKLQAKTFRDLSPREAKRRLGILVDKIDKDHDGHVTKEELRDWVKHVHERSNREVAEKRWIKFDTDNDGFISFQEMKMTTFGADPDPEEIFDKERGLNNRDSEKRVFKRFKTADENGDNKLSLEEYTDFLYPHEVERLKEVVIDELFSDLDKNKNGFVTLEEYIANIWHPTDSSEEEPSWLKTEREQFTTHKDKNSDGTLDREEVAIWLYPGNYDRYIAEAAHLMYHGDTDKDKILTKDEILANQELFVGSQATEFGRYFERHDEF